MKTSLKKNSIFRGGALALATMFLFATVVVQPVQAQGVAKSIACATLTKFASASYTALDLSVAAMNATFKLQLNLLEASWKVQDQAIELHRSLSEAAFKALLAVYAAVTSWTAAEKAAVQTYKTTMENALTVFRTKIDATRAAYREDMLALVKAHQKALTDLVTTAVTTIKTALDTATKNCSDAKAKATAKLLAVIAKAKLDLAIKSVAQEATDLVKATKLTLNRNRGYDDAYREYARAKLDATMTLMKATLGWNKETAAAQQDLDQTAAAAQ